MGRWGTAQTEGPASIQRCQHDAGGGADEMVTTSNGSTEQNVTTTCQAGWSWAFDTPFDLVQTERVKARRHQPEHGGIVAGAHQGQGRLA